jgi:hypothetical protein
VFDEEASLPHYSDEIYRDAVDRGLMRVNLALQTSYSIDQVPTTAEFLVELKATIEMCYVRGAEGATGDVTDQPELATQTMTLPGGFTQSNQQMSYEGARFWGRLADRLAQEYKEALDEVLCNLQADGAVVVGTMQRMSLRTCRATSYVYDRPLAAPEIALAVSGNSVVISWSPILSEFLETYTVQRSTDSFSTVTDVYLTSDNQASVYVDTGVPVGEYSYRLRVENTNQLVSYSAAGQVSVT